MGKTRTIAVSLFVLVLLLVTATAAFATPGQNFGQLYYDGEIVRTLVPPAASPKPGKDPIYVVMGGADGQLPVAGVGPGDKGYHGGQWAVYTAEWVGEPYLLTSAAAVHAAADAGDLILTRAAGADFRCPIQP